MANTNQSGTNLFGDTGNSALQAALTDTNGYIYFGKCTGEPPTTADYFQHGCLLVQTDSDTAAPAVWQNVGSVASPSWQTIDATGSRVTEVTVTSAELLAIGTTPVTLIPAQGSGTVVMVEDAAYTLVAGTTAYSGGSALRTTYTNGAGAQVLANVTSAFVNTSSGTVATMILQPTAIAVTAVANAPVVLSGVGASPTAGNGVLNASIRWRLINQS